MSGNLSFKPIYLSQHRFGIISKMVKNCRLHLNIKYNPQVHLVRGQPDPVKTNKSWFSHIYSREKQKMYIQKCLLWHHRWDEWPLSQWAIRGRTTCFVLTFGSGCVDRRSVGKNSCVRPMTSCPFHAQAKISRLSKTSLKSTNTQVSRELGELPSPRTLLNKSMQSDEIKVCGIS